MDFGMLGFDGRDDFRSRAKRVFGQRGDSSTEQIEMKSDFSRGITPSSFCRILAKFQIIHPADDRLFILQNEDTMLPKDLYAVTLSSLIPGTHHRIPGANPEKTCPSNRRYPPP
jgi:hypothetical protein